LFSYFLSIYAEIKVKEKNEKKTKKVGPSSQDTIFVRIEDSGLLSKKSGALGYTEKKDFFSCLAQDTIFVRIEDSFRTFGPHRKKVFARKFGQQNI